MNHFLTSSLAIYCSLFLLKGAYAYALSRSHWWEPDLIWFFVAVGVGFCCIAAGIDRRLNGPFTAETYELRIWAALLIGGIPMAGWQISRSISAYKRFFGRAIKRVDTDGDTA